MKANTNISATIDDPVFTPKEAAHILRVKWQTLADWRCMYENHGPKWIKRNGRIYYRKSAIEAYLNGEENSEAA